MESLLILFVLIPFVGMIISFFTNRFSEKVISGVAIGTLSIHFLFGLIFLGYWLFHEHPFINHRDIALYKSEHYEFFIDLLFDKITAVYLFVGSFLTFMVVMYSRYYLHREEGYHRFFSNVLFFFLGYNIVIFAGNLETMFIGWEILGLSSFLLIAFYRDRYLPVKNAVKVFSIYRIADVGLLLAMWMTHHLWHQNITFVTLYNEELVSEHIQQHSLIGVGISLMLLVAAVVKSAQLPFSSWLPRAMEGPTPSSAIFYGSLSVHIGAFILLRTYPFWEHQTSVRILFALVGLASALVATGISRVQSTIKSQIAYSSIAQIGIIFIEISLGLEYLALLHFAGNAFLRTYQLLVSPSVVSYKIREQFFTFQKRKHRIGNKWSKRFAYSYYLLCLKEWNLDNLQYRYLWNPIKRFGKKLDFLTVSRALFIVMPIILIGIILLFNQDLLSESTHHAISYFFGILGLVLVIKSFSERQNVFLSWVLIMLNHASIALSVSFNENYGINENFMYLSGIGIGGSIGYYILTRIRNYETGIDMDQFHGHIKLHPRLGFFFLLCSLSITGFPISPTVIGEDLVFSHIHEDQIGLAAMTALSLILDGLSAVRIYARVFLGPHVKSKFEVAYRSS